ncbi:sugar phosphate isomerase/epimerase [Halobacteriales archaeon QS_1_68_20]|nr:MAG: sugar phosphate isomerase/epimerase [Halobacteriales archaeon QS_1_68_20]
MRAAVRLPVAEASEGTRSETLARVAEAGFDGVAFADLERRHLRPVAAALGEAGLEPVSVTVSHDRLQAERKAVVRDLATVGCGRVVVPPVHEAHFETPDAINRMATRLSALGGRLATSGQTLCYRNDTHEFRRIDPPGETDDAAERSLDAFDLLVERSGEGLAFELDVGAVTAAGRDPAAVLGRLTGRVPLVALRDVDADGDPVSLGDGVVDVDVVVDAAREAGVEWLVYGEPVARGSTGSQDGRSGSLDGELE